MTDRFEEKPAASAADSEEIEAVELPVSGDGLGLMLVGSRSAGVFVKSIKTGSVAEMDGRIRPGDQILAVNSTNLVGFEAGQAARIIRLCQQQALAEHIQLVVAHAKVVEGPSGIQFIPRRRSRDLLGMLRRESASCSFIAGGAQCSSLRRSETIDTQIVIADVTSGHHRGQQKSTGTSSSLRKSSSLVVPLNLSHRDAKDALASSPRVTTTLFPCSMASGPKFPSPSAEQAPSSYRRSFIARDMRALLSLRAARKFAPSEVVPLVTFDQLSATSISNISPLITGDTS